MPAMLWFVEQMRRGVAVYVTNMPEKAVHENQELHLIEGKIWFPSAVAMQ